MSESQGSAKPLDFEDARQIVIESVRSLGNAFLSETVRIEQAHRRVLAQDVIADRDYPALRRSLRDGFALNSSEVPGKLALRGEIRAGETAHRLNPGEAIEIMTGAPVPEGADAVVMIEHVSAAGWNAFSKESKSVNFERAVEAGQFINEPGAEAKKAAVLIMRGTRLDGSHIASLAMTGQASVPVAVRPSVSILATGDEIVGIETSPQDHQIRNSNTYMLASLVAEAGGLPQILPVAKDNPDDLRASLQQGLQSDMLIVSGGVSAGKYDLVKPILRDLGVNFLFERVRVQPGQPTAYGVAGTKPVFGLPGNPGSSFVTFQLFARPAIELLSGLQTSMLPLLSARFSKPFRHKPGLTRFLPAILAEDGQSLEHVPWQGSSDVPALAKANCFLVADHDRESWNIGEEIRVMWKP